MEKEILKKEKGKVIKSTRKDTLDSKPYIMNCENCFNGIIDQKSEWEFKLNNIYKLEKQINHILSDVSIFYKDYVNIIYNKIKNSNSIFDLKMTFKYFLKIYEEMLKERYKKSKKGKEIVKKYIDNAQSDFKNNFDLVISVLIKSVTKMYYNDKLSLCTLEKINLLETLKVKDVSIETIMNEIGCPYGKEKNNGFKNFSSKILLNLIDEKYDASQFHLCYLNCKNATTLLCPKIADRRKKYISSYDFIIDGYQIVNNNDIEVFVVSNCLKYEEQHEKKFNIEQQRRINEIVKSIKMHYFDAETIEEANAIEKNMIKKNELKPFYNYYNE